MDEDLLVFMDGEKQIRLERPEKGTVVEGESLVWESTWEI